MGNCLRHDNGFAGKEKDNLEPELPVELLEEGKGSSGEEGGSERSTQKESKVVRIKVVVTKGELRQILGHKKGTNSIQHLAHVLKDSGRNISRAYEEEEEQGDENWRPTLETISMGNCLRHDNGFAGKEKDNLEPELPVELLEEGKGSSGEEGGSERSTQKESKVVRIKVVVTKGELRQILGHKKGTNSIQHLAHVLKDSGRNISRAYEEEEEQGDENWRPTLESIPENHY
ncbi:hypothetical protein YC2023_011903 [Brassica napus]